MIVDPYILNRLTQVNEKLEVGLQEVAVNACEEEEHDEELNRLLKQLLRIRKIVDPVSKFIQKRHTRGYYKVDYEVVLTVLQELQNIPFQTGRLNQIVGNAIDSYIIILCFYTLTNKSYELLNPSYEAQEYYQNILESNSNCALYALQTGPARSFNFVLNNVRKVRNELAFQEDALRYTRMAVTGILREVKGKIRRVLMVHEFKLGSNNTKHYLSSVTNISKALIHDNVQGTVHHAEKFTQGLTTNLGQLSYDLLGKDNITDNKANLANFLNIPEKSSLAKIVEHTAKFSQKDTAFKVPALLTRTWPIILIGLLYGPPSLSNLWMMRYDIWKFFQRNVLEFATGLIQNWVWTPLKQIWATVRHDSESSIAVVSKSSLDSEMNSLSRMIVSFVSENADTSINIEELNRQVEHGDLTQFLEIYETQLYHPVKNILTGDLVRSLLIQIQKTKVDGSLALNGIDKMLQSQQLVFGVVAMSPAFIILYMAYVGLIRFIKLGTIWSNKRTYIQKVNNSLSNTERILNYDHHDQNMYLNHGLLVIEANNLYNYGSLLIPKKRHSQWLQDVQELLMQKFGKQTRLNVVNRIYHSYGRYFLINE